MGRGRKDEVQSTKDENECGIRIADCGMGIKRRNRGSTGSPQANHGPRYTRHQQRITNRESRTTNHGSTSSPQAKKRSGRTKPFRRKLNAAREKGRGLPQSEDDRHRGAAGSVPARLGIGRGGAEQRPEEARPRQSCRPVSGTMTRFDARGRRRRHLDAPLCPQIARQRAKSPRCLNLRGKSLCYATVIPQAGAVASKECSRAEVQECAGPA